MLCSPSEFSDVGYAWDVGHIAADRTRSQTPRHFLIHREARSWPASGRTWQDWPGRDRADDGTVMALTFVEFSAELLRRLTTRSVVVHDDGTLSFPRAGGYWLV